MSLVNYSSSDEEEKVETNQLNLTQSKRYGNLAKKLKAYI